MASGKAVAIIAGVGPGTGASCARRFAKAYPVVLLARKPENFEGLVSEINSSGGKALGVSTDVSSESSVKDAMNKVEEAFGGDVGVAAAVFNASGPFARKPFLEVGVEEFKSSWSVSVQGAMIFAQAVLPRMLPLAYTSASAANGRLPPTLIFTGATASIKANALMSGFAAPKFAMRALATSLAKEFAPQGVHVAHAVIDGVIDIPRTKAWLEGMPPEAKIGADDIAESYWNLHTQGVRCFTNEIDIRPMMEKW